MYCSEENRCGNTFIVLVYGSSTSALLRLATLLRCCELCMCSGQWWTHPSTCHHFSSLYSTLGFSISELPYALPARSPFKVKTVLSGLQFCQSILSSHVTNNILINNVFTTVRYRYCAHALCSRSVTLHYGLVWHGINVVRSK